MPPLRSYSLYRYVHSQSYQYEPPIFLLHYSSLSLSFNLCMCESFSLLNSLSVCLFLSLSFFILILSLFLTFSLSHFLSLPLYLSLSLSLYLSICLLNFSREFLLALGFHEKIISLILQPACPSS